MTDIPLAAPTVGASALTFIEEALEENYVSSVGPFVSRFEGEFARTVGSRYAIACSSGTAALHVAMIATGAGQERLVVAPTFTFIASVNAISYTGATPWLVDSDEATWNLDAGRLHDAIVHRAENGERLPDVIEVVHIYGHPADIEPLLVLRDRFDISIVEDAAEALGALYVTGAAAGKHVGTIGDIGCFSFNGNKVITTGAGGMLVTENEELAERARHLTTQARTSRTDYDHDEIGFNYRMSNLAAAVGLSQLEDLNGHLEKKASISSRYRRELDDLPLSLGPDESWAKPSQWLNCVLFDEGRAARDRVREAMAQEGIESRNLWKPIHTQKPYLSTERLGGEVADDLYTRGLSLPSSVGLTPEDQGRVIDVLRHAF